MSPWTAFALIAAAGALLAAASALGVRAAGGQPRMARRLAGAREARVGALRDRTDGGGRPMRVTGRIRCRDPLLIGADRLVAYHRDVEVLLERIGWRSVERLREARSFDLWDHDGSLTMDPARVAEPLITIPSVWRGRAAELQEPHASAARQLEERHGVTAIAARSTIRTVNVTDRLLVLARVTLPPSGGVVLEPPEGGYLVTSLALDDAMRLLGGRRRLMAGSLLGIAVGLLMTLGGVVAAIAAAALGG